MNNNTLIEIIVSYVDGQVFVEVDKISGCVINDIAYYNSFMGIITCGPVDTIIKDKESVD